MSTAVRRKDGGYATFPNRWIDAGYMAKAPGSVSQVYFFLCRWADNTTWASAQPMRLIAYKCGLSEDVARKAVRVLEAWGVITRESESGPNACNVWTLNNLPPDAPDYPDKVPPKQSGGPQTTPPESWGPYQPTAYQPENNQPERRNYLVDVKSAENPDWTDRVMENGVTFAAFWQVYPRKEAKQDAMKAWQKLSPSIAFAQRILEAVDAQVNNNWAGRDRKYIPLPATWINGKRWEDEIVPYQAPGRPANPNYYKPNGGLTAEGMAAKARGEIQ